MRRLSPQLFWAALTVGRLVAVPVSAWLQPRHLMLGAAGLSLVALALAQSLAPVLTAPLIGMVVGARSSVAIPTVLMVLALLLLTLGLWARTRSVA